MAAPNLIGATTINGKTTGANLTSTNGTTVLNNPSGSGKCLKVNTLNVSNYTGSSANITINWNNGANLSGTSFAIAGITAVPPYTTLNVIDKSRQYYLEENTSFGATAGTPNALVVTISYEDIS
jgi:hypothetical protein